ncbi:DUF4118 domain-containing protein [Dactylosporangium sp. AC04546]|uniref:DUF4118 domain-containing protein n=1 Tax=Dactylosporangium sp. AC04546 TaxID=2862460 RepID=UPI002E7B5B1C|nr:DUF4118 domain-containing protein [Dactylosporangium sp. AC04546]WVK78824.1 DUF4118 domain-containing protein [Dactylosporangium sp. AC04546]
MPRYPGRGMLALAAAVVAPLAVAAALIPFRDSLSAANAALVLVVVVVAVAAIGNRLAGALAALSAAAWFDLFLTEPYGRFTITTSADITTAALLLVVGLAVSQIAARARRLHLVTITDADHLAHIQHTAALVQSGAQSRAVVSEVRTQLVDLLHLQGCRFEYGTLLGHPARLERDGSITQGRVRRNLLRDELPDEEIELRASAGGRFYGRFMLQPTHGAVVPLQARLVAVTLADQTAAALDAARPDETSGPA